MYVVEHIFELGQIPPNPKPLDMVLVGSFDHHILQTILT